MIRRIGAAVCGLMIMLPGILSAATLTATFNTNVTALGFDGSLAGETAFVIEFDDTEGTIAGVLEEDEFLSFAWVNNPFTIGVNEFFTVLGVAPSIAGVVDGFAFTPFSAQNNNWVFGQETGGPTGTSVAVGSFTYSTALPPPPPLPPVPLPAAGFLLIGALGGLAALRRRAA